MFDGEPCLDYCAQFDEGQAPQRRVEILEVIQKGCEWLAIREESDPQFFLQAAGLAQVEAARNDGRWATAYAGSATMVIPKDFLAALQQDPAAHAFYATLKRQSLFTIYHRLHSAKRPENWQKHMAELLAKLARGASP